VAVIGAGPAGLFAAEALLKQKGVQVDVFDRSPAPFGLVRDGVAPDHPSKAAAALLDRIAANPALRFFGNVSLGKDLSASDLSRLYDQVIYAVGGDSEKKLGIPGEDLEGVHGASSFTGWYNARPDGTAKAPDLSGRHAVVIGAGAVGLDAARMLTEKPARLAHSEISGTALEALRKSGIKEVHLLGRRGPDDATISPDELRELSVLESADLVVRPKDLERGEADGRLAAQLAEQAKRGEGTKDKKVRLRFFTKPVEIVGKDGRVVGVKVQNADGSLETIPADLVVRSIGSRTTPLPGVPYDEARGVIPNEGGRVVDPSTGRVVPGAYVAGWAKHGATGRIGDQRVDAQATARTMLEDAAEGRIARTAAPADEVVTLLKSRGVRFVDRGDWKIIDRLEREAGMAASKAREKFASVKAMLAALDAAKAGPAAAAPTPRSTQGPLYTVIKGVRHPLGYNPALGVRPLWKDILEWIVHFPSKIMGVYRYTKRVRQSLEEITDDDMRWSLMRFGAFENQEGILRQGNRELVHDWKPWSAPSLVSVGPDDFNGSSVSRISIRKIFKQAMDREEPTRAYQYTSSMNLHNYLPRVAHFMGVTMQERVIAIALKGAPPERSVWAMEEERHGNIMETVYNLSRLPGQPEMREQGISPTSPKAGESSARSMLANRALAEIGAATGYLMLKSNAKKGSPSDLALEGIFRDEVYHYVLMDAARKWGFGMRSRWARLRNIIRHYNDNQLPEAVDAVVDERKGFSPLVIFEIAYAFYQIDKRVDRYLRTVDDKEGLRLVGKAYQNEKQVREAIARGEHTWTDPFPMEVNPEMSAHDVRELERRFPGRFDNERRRLKSEQITEILERYRETLRSPGYWQRKKGFAKVSADGAAVTRLERTVGFGEDAAAFTLAFPVSGAEPLVSIRAGEAGRVVYEGPMKGLSLRQLGLVFGAESARALRAFDAVKKDFTPREIVGRLLDNPLYRRDPIPLDGDPPSVPARETGAEAAVAAQPFKAFMCLVCGYKYSEADGDPARGIPPGTRWEDLPDDWICPECGETKAAFEEDMVEVAP
jgi:ferredoxin--NADP+ reductase